VSDNWPSRKGDTQTEPRPPAVTFVTTEHFVLQGARAATIAESTGRANMFVAAVSGGLIALGLVATASRVGIAFYAFGLVPFPAPEIAPYLLSVPPAERLGVQGLVGARWQEFRTVAGMVGLITSVLAGSTATLASILLFDHSLAAALIAGGLVALPVLAALMRFERSVWDRESGAPLIRDGSEQGLPGCRQESAC